MSKAKTVEGVLKASLRRIRHRWTKGSWKKERPLEAQFDGRGTNSYCLVGSVTGGKTDPDNEIQARALRLIEEEIQRRTGRRQSIPGFNDAQSTRQEDVIAVVEGALQRAKTAGV